MRRQGPHFALGGVLFVSAFLFPFTFSLFSLERGTRWEISLSFLIKHKERITQLLQASVCQVDAGAELLALFCHDSLIEQRRPARQPGANHGSGAMQSEAAGAGKEPVQIPVMVGIGPDFVHVLNEFHNGHLITAFGAAGTEFGPDR